MLILKRYYPSLLFLPSQKRKTPVGETGVYYLPAGQIIALFTF